MIRICDDPKGEAYGKLMDYAVGRCSQFVLVVQDDLGFSESGQRVLAALEPHLMEKTRSDRWPGTRILDKTAWVCYYRCSEKAAEVLKEAANSLYSWQQPALPEDLSFLTEDGTPWLVNTAHESWAGINGEPEEAISLSNSIQGLFLGGEFNEGFEDFIRDAVRHQPESLEVAGYHIRKLPGWVGNLTELKTLSVLTRDLREIPKEIGKLENLRRLEICCGSYMCEEGEAVEPLGIPRLSVLPEEIGRLKQLEYLSIGCTSITRLPREIGNLYNLRSLHLNSNSIEALPEEIGNLKNLESLWLDKNKLKGLPDTIGSLSRLQFLSVSDNELLCLPKTLDRLEALTYINLSNNTLPKSEIDNVRRCEKVEIAL